MLNINHWIMSFVWTTNSCQNGHDTRWLHTQWFKGHSSSPGEPGLSSFPLHSPFPPFHHVLLRQATGWRWRKRSGGKVHSTRSIWVLTAGCPSCHQPVLKTSTGTHPFFNRQQTPEERDAAPCYTCSQTSVHIQNIYISAQLLLIITHLLIYLLTY